MLGGGAKDARNADTRARARCVRWPDCRRRHHCLRPVLCSPDLRAAAHRVACLWHCCDLPHQRDHRRLRRRAQFAAFRDCRTRSHDCRGHGDARKRARGAASRQRRIRRSPCAGRRHHGPFRGLHRHLVVRPRACGRRRCNPLHSLSRHWRFSRSNRLLDGKRGSPRYHRPPD